MDGGEKPTDKQPEDEPAAQWNYASDEATSQEPLPPLTASGDEVEWTASEFIDHTKGAGWYSVLGLVGFLIAAGVYVVTRDIFSVVVIGVLAAVIGVSASRPPRVMTYRLNRSGLIIGKKVHPYGEFKSFSVIDEGAFASISFTPLKRFMPPVNIYFSPEDEQRIIEVLARHLPMQPASHDIFDVVMRQIRF